MLDYVSTGIIEDCSIYNNSAANVCLGNNPNLNVEPVKTNQPVFRRCEIYNSQIGIIVDQNCQALIENSNIYGNTVSQVFVAGGGTAIVRQSQVRNEQGIFVNGEATIESWSISECLYGVSVKEGGKLAISRCKISGNEHGVLTGDKSAGVIENCDIFDNELAISVAVADDWQILNCRIYENKNLGVAFGGQSAGTIEQVAAAFSVLFGKTPSETVKALVRFLFQAHRAAVYNLFGNCHKASSFRPWCRTLIQSGGSSGIYTAAFLIRGW